MLLAATKSKIDETKFQLWNWAKAYVIGRSLHCICQIHKISKRTILSTQAAGPILLVSYTFFLFSAIYILSTVLFKRITNPCLRCLKQLLKQLYFSVFFLLLLAFLSIFLIFYALSTISYSQANIWCVTYKKQSFIACS